MATEVGANIVEEDLIFGFDSGYGVADNSTSTRFYPGEPTVNYVTDSPTGGGWSGGVDVIDSATKTLKFKIQDFNGSPGAGWRSFTWDMTSHSGEDVTISATFEYQGPVGQMAFVYIGQANTYTNNGGAGQYLGYSPTSDRTSKTTGTRERISWSGTIGSGGSANQPSGHIGLTVWINNGVDGGSDSYIVMSNIQIEKKDHATPFVNGTRSNTASLIDLKRINNVDVANTSFTSTGQPTFDGTDDRLSTGLFNGRNPFTSPFTIEAMVKSDVTSGSRMWLDVNGNGSSQRLYCAYAATGTSNPMGIQSSGWSSSGVNDTDFHHYVITMNGSTATLYNNGEVHSEKPYTSYTLPSNIQAGGRAGYRWVGPIPVFKLYGKALSANEIKQNYNAYKKRFDL